jgi:adenylosuccinate lyase
MAILFLTDFHFHQQLLGKRHCRSSPDTITNRVIANVLAERYASENMQAIWSAEGRIQLEREFWIAVMKAQKDLGLDIPDEAIAAYEKVKNQIDVASIMHRERTTRHDVKARIEEYNDLAGHEHVHKGMTSRDLTENVEQLQVYKSLFVLRDKCVAVLHRFRKHAESTRHLVLTARTHNVAAQPTTMGQRLAMVGEEYLHSLRNLQSTIEQYHVRGLKGAVGTQMDQLSLFDGDASKVSALEQRIVNHLGMKGVWINVGQVYPRSLDFREVSSLTDLASAPSSFCKTLRLMAGHETASEGFAPGQTGSSAMPHKMNSRSCERVNGFHVILKGYLAMAAGLAGDQWNEGDVSCSVVRRVMLPDAFFALDGLLETFLTILDQMETYPEMIASETQHYLPFLMTTTVMMEAVKNGVGRETAHKAIKEHAVATVQDLRRGKIDRNNLIERLAHDVRLGLTREILDHILKKGETETGAADPQVDWFSEAVQTLEAEFPNALTYAPGAIL